jgi:hypothetical protein
MKGEDMQAVVDALQIMMRLRSSVPYRSRGFLLLNAACHRLSERFWRETRPISCTRETLCRAR